MAEAFYSIEQVAEHLGLHVKTVRNYVREGRLKAVRIGKQYRIAAADLAAMTGRPAASFEPEPVRRTRHVEVSSVVEIDAVSPELFERVTPLVVGAAGARDFESDHPAQVQAIYDASRGRLKVILIGSLETTVSLLSLIKVIVEVKQ
jgi:excisionase family DNA binding protein